VDGSWVLANSWAHPLGLTWGRDLAYTYGPLGFLHSALPFSSPLLLGGLAFWLGSSLVLLWAALRVQGPGIGSWVVAFLAASIASTVSDIAMPVVAVALLAIAIRIRPPAMPLWLVFLGIGLAGSALLLTKFNAGITSLAVAGVLAAFGPGSARCLAALASGALAGLLGLWLASGGAVGDLGTFLGDSLSLSLGYSHALSNGSRTPGALMVYLAGAGLLVTMLVCGWFASRGVARAVRAGVVLALLVLGTSTWLQGFSRFDPGHLAIFFAAIGSMCLVLISSAMVGMPWVRALCATGCFVAVSAPLLIVLGSPGGGQPVQVAGPSTIVHPVTSVRNVRDVLQLTRDADARTHRLESLRAQFRAEAALSPEVARALSGARAHAEPQAVGAVWAAGAQWRPVPVYQTHMAYTEHLDQRNAESIVTPESADVILREDFGLDGTNPLWQSPRLQVEYLCRFTESVSDARWRVLVRAADICQDPRPLGRTEVEAATATPVPRAEGIVIATLDQATGLRGRLEVRCDGRPYQLMQALPSGPLIMRIPDSVGWSLQSHPNSCEQLEFSAPVSVSWSEIPVLSP
jgi:hypothetical protein